MGKSVNKALLLGYVGKAPQIRSTAGGTLAASFSLATSDRLKDREGQWTERTEWHNLVAFGRSAEIIRDYVSKGSQLFVQGKIQTRTWDDRESGQKVYRTEIVISDLTLLGGNREGNGASGHGDRRSGANQTVNGSRSQDMDQQYGNEELDPSQIPF
ncbi:MAG TPA: single-stranded DNA-binding protein [Terracidiphilus sp.]|nr:single-stranded DNA-binding protein [Terracidiphilus sp.]